MSLLDRLQLYRRIEESRQRPLVVFVTSCRPRANGLMAADAIPELLDQLSEIPSTQKSVDLLVVSQGGDPTVAWRIMCLLRERFETIGVLVPQSAFSAATLLCLGADEIVMHPNGNLGPVDPQVTGKRKTGKDTETDIRFGYEEVLAFIHFIKDRAHITDQKELAGILSKLLEDIGCVNVGIAMRGSMLSQSLGENLLKMHMTGEGEAAKAKSIAEALNKKFFHHGYALGRQEARDIGLKVRECDLELEGLIWGVWQDLERELKMRQSFSPITELAAVPTSAPLFEAAPVVNFPQGLPPQVAQLVFQQISSQLQIAINTVPPVDASVVFAVLESVRLCSRFIGRKKISGIRQPDGTISCSVVDVTQGWEPEPRPSYPAVAAPIEAPVREQNPLQLPADGATMPGADEPSLLTPAANSPISQQPNSRPNRKPARKRQ